MYVFNIKICCHYWNQNIAMEGLVFDCPAFYRPVCCFDIESKESVNCH